MKNRHAAALGKKGGKAGTGKVKARSSEQARAAANARWTRTYTLCRYPVQGVVESFNFTAKNHAEALLTVSEIIQDAKTSDKWARVWVRCNDHLNYIYDWSAFA